MEPSGDRAAPPAEVRAASTHPPEAAEDAGWHPLRRWLFRFGCLYFAGYALPDFAAGQANPLRQATDRTAAWIGTHLLGLGEIHHAPTGSGDMAVHYVELLLLSVGALAGSLLWSLLDRRRTHYRRLGQILWVAARYCLMSVMLAYGFAKIFAAQFPAPDLTRLVQPIGDASPMGLLWTTMGYSRPYSTFAGALEVIGGLLLAGRRTTTLGAAIVAAVMSNVVMMNLSYDVPVKLYSSHLLLLALVLLALDGRRLLRVWVLGRAVPATHFPVLTSSPRGRRAARLVKALVIAVLLASNLSPGLNGIRAEGRAAIQPPLWGIYDVTAFTLDDELLPPLSSDTRRWRTMIFDRRHQLTLQRMDGTLERHSFAVEGANKLQIYHRDDRRSAWVFERPAADELRLRGEIDGRAYALTLAARDADDFPLLRRGFHWINETPYNR